MIPAGGRYLMLCYSNLQPGDWGPSPRHSERDPRQLQRWMADRLPRTGLAASFTTALVVFGAAASIAAALALRVFATERCS